MVQAYSNSVEVTAASGTHRTPTRRVASHPDEIVHNMAVNPLQSCWDFFSRSVESKGTSDMLGWRNTDTSDPNKGAFQWISYAEVMNLALSVGSACLLHNLVPEQCFPNEQYTNARKLKQIGLFSKNRVEWFVLEQAANAYGITLIPLYDALSEDAIIAILNQTRVSTIAGSTTCLKRLIEIKTKHSEMPLKNLIIFDSYPQKPKTLIDKELGLEDRTEENKLSLFYYSEFIQHKSPILDIKPATLQDVSTICYTSGTTGDPKGVILTHQNAIAAVSGAVRGPLSYSYGLNVNSDDTHFSYLPLAHVFERIICNVAIFLGASIGIACENTHKLLDDLAVLRPTIFVSVPRLFYRIHEHIFTAVNENYSSIGRWIFNFGLERKINRIKNTAEVKDQFWDPLVFSKIYQRMGGRLRFMLVGSACLESDVEDQLKAVFCTPLCEGYGLTETFGASFASLPSRSFSGTIGFPVPCIEFCLEDVPEMNYLVENNSGELLLRGPSIFPGYFLNKEATESVIDKDGWFHTGDIAVLLSNGDLKILDRKKNIFKLTQGEYVSPERLETIYERSLYVKQIYVYGDSSRNCLVGIIYPNEDAIKQWISARQSEGKVTNEIKNVSDIFNGETMHKEILHDLDCVANENKLKGFEKVKAVHLITQPFTIENNLLTPTLKLRRHNVHKHFEEQIHQMYTMLKK